MWSVRETVIIGKAYPVMCGYGWRCFDGTKWHDCDKDGRIKKYGVKEE